MATNPGAWDMFKTLAVNEVRSNYLDMTDEYHSFIKSKLTRKERNRLMNNENVTLDLKDIDDITKYYQMDLRLVFDEDNEEAYQLLRSRNPVDGEMVESFIRAKQLNVGAKVWFRWQGNCLEFKVLGDSNNSGPYRGPDTYLAV